MSIDEFEASRYNKLSAKPSYLSKASRLFLFLFGEKQKCYFSDLHCDRFQIIFFFKVTIVYFDLR